MALKLEPISAERFAPFGHIVEQATAFGRIDYVASVENGRSHARANLATVRLQPTPLPVMIPRLEKHAYSTQAFIPLDVARYCAIVAPDRDGAPDMTQAIAFVVPSGSGISYRLGTWHTGMMVLDRPGSLAILTHEDGSADDCTFYSVEPFEVDL